LRRLLLVLGIISLILASATSLSATQLSVGGFAGLNLPVAMDDVKMGMAYGFKARIALMPSVGIEPNFMIASYGEGEAEVYDETYTRDGGEITSFGVDIVFGGISGKKGASFFVAGGIGSSKWSRDGIDDVTEMSFNLGVGMEYGVAEMISIELRAKAMVIPHDDGSYKNGMITGGLNYFFNLGGGE